jgi:phosphoribosylformylglycinamidine cyclo-ligase
MLISENLNRCLPADVDAVVHRNAWHRPRLFELLAEATHLPEDELHRTFNMGIGLCLVMAPHDAADAAAALREAGETIFEIGEIVPGTGVVRYA